MSQTMIIFLTIAAIVILLGLATLLLFREIKERETEARVIQAVGEDTTKIGDRMVGWLRGFGDRFKRFQSPANIEHLRSMVIAAGYNPHRVMPMMLGGKVAILVLCPVLAFIIGMLFADSVKIRFAILGVGVVLGMLGPEWILGHMRRRFVAQIDRGTPDALDLLIICTEAGNGLETALERVSFGLLPANRPMASVLGGLLDDLRVTTQQEAFVNLGTRSGSDGLKRVGAMISQSMRYGTPLSNALRNVAGELRTGRANKLEEQAVKLGTKLIFPMLAFIFPTLLIVLLGTSFIDLYDSLQPILSQANVHIH